MDTPDVEAVPAFTLRALAIALEIGLAVIGVGNIMLAGYHIDLLLQRLHCLIGVVELLILGQMGNVAGVDDEGRRRRHRVDLGDRLLKGAERIGIGRLVEADMTIADLQKGQIPRWRFGSHAF